MKSRCRSRAPKAPTMHPRAALDASAFDAPRASQGAEPRANIQRTSSASVGTQYRIEARGIDEPSSRLLATLTSSLARPLRRIPLCLRRWHPRVWLRLPWVISRSLNACRREFVGPFRTVCVHALSCSGRAQRLNNFDFFRFHVVNDSTRTSADVLTIGDPSGHLSGIEPAACEAPTSHPTHAC